MRHLCPSGGRPESRPPRGVPSGGYLPHSRDREVFLPTRPALAMYYRGDTPQTPGRGVAPSGLPPLATDFPRDERSIVKTANEDSPARALARRQGLSMAIERVLPDVYRIGLGYVSAYVIAQEEVTVIDTGLPKHREIILKAASQAGRKAEEVKHILLTHHHADHTGSLAELDRKSTRLNSSHPSISYAVFCLKKKKHN